MARRMHLTQDLHSILNAGRLRPAMIGCPLLEMSAILETDGLTESPVTFTRAADLFLALKITQSDHVSLLIAPSLMARVSNSVLCLY